MTAIAAMADGTVTWIGADSAGVSGYDLTIRADEKVFTTGPYVLGFTSSFRMGQLLRYRLEPPAPPEDGMDLMRFMVTDFTDAIRECLKTGGWAKKENEREEGGVFVVGVNGRLFEVWSDYQVCARADSYAAAGSGENYILGALHATEGLGLEPEKRLLTALEAAERFSTGVAGPFRIVRSPEPET